MAEVIADALHRAWTSFLEGLGGFLPRLLAMLAIVLAGWIIAWVTSFLLRQVLRWVKVNALADRTGGAEMLRRAALPPADAFISSLVFWLVWVAFMLSGLSSLGFPGLEGLGVAFVTFLPRLTVGIFIFIVGLVAANFAWRATLLASVNANLPSARLLSGAVRWLVLALAVAMALEQVGVAKTVVLTAFAIAFGALMLGMAIAVGIGGGDVARRLLDRQFPPPQERKEDSSEDISHL